jgi:hypothetical protein
MPAETTAQLLSIETAIEAATRTILDSAGLHENYLPRSADSLPRSYIEITATLGEAINQGIHASGDTQYLDWDYYQALLQIRLLTERAPENPTLPTATSQLHTTWLGGVRAALLESTCPYTEALLPYHAINMIKPLNTTRDLEPNFLHDITTLEYQLQVGIRSEAWPTS